VNQIEEITQELLNSLTTKTPAKSREALAAKAKQRFQKRAMTL